MDINVTLVQALWLFFAFMIVAGVGAGAYTGKLVFRPFRTTSIIMAMLLLALVWLGLQHDFNMTGAIEALGAPEEAAVAINIALNLVVDVSVFMVAVTGLVGSILELSKDGGESDSVKVTKMFLDRETQRQCQVLPMSPILNSTGSICSCQNQDCNDDGDDNKDKDDDEDTSA